jgi:hypothetical protein
MFEIQNANVNNKGRVTKFMNWLKNTKLFLSNNYPHPIINIFDIPTSTFASNNNKIKQKHKKHSFSTI